MIKKSLAIVAFVGKRCFEAPIKLRLMLITVMKLAVPRREKLLLWGRTFIITENRSSAVDEKAAAIVVTTD